jgi:hypothetical protein
MGTGRDYLAMLELPSPADVTAVTVRVPEDAPPFVLRGLSLLDASTGAHTSVTVSQRGDLRRIHSGDVKLYERMDAPGRAWLVHGLRPAVNTDDALRQAADPAFDPRAAVILEGDVPLRVDAPPASWETVEALEQEPERQIYRVRAGQLAALVVADAAYPGWRVMVDGFPARLERANGMFRAVLLDAGLHSVVFEYRPETWRLGAAISLVCLSVLALLVTATFVAQRS